ncbi:HD domain-containing protein [Eubacteriales bacterium OttesenSCG-928-M02]|nr:HD domain-containing protein [Eubacteriales bacterium OttesenSCG-928-M02]
MTQEDFGRIERHMLLHMQDSAHDKNHIYRVLYNALLIGAAEQAADQEILIAACLLHDIAREAQRQDKAVDHALLGGEWAYDFLLEEGWKADRAERVKSCIQSHRYRADRHPKSLEAKILFDADKLDVAGAMGVARTLVYGGSFCEPIYRMDEKGEVRTVGTGEEPSSFFEEFNYKLRNIYDGFYTEKGRTLALLRRNTAISFYDGLMAEVQQAHGDGEKILDGLLT